MSAFNNATWLASDKSCSDKNDSSQKRLSFLGRNEAEIVRYDMSYFFEYLYKDEYLLIDLEFELQVMSAAFQNIRVK